MGRIQEFGGNVLRINVTNGQVPQVVEEATTPVVLIAKIKGLIKQNSLQTTHPDFAKR